MFRSTLMKMNADLIARLHAEQATNCALRGMLEAQGKIASDYVIDAEPSFEFTTQASRAEDSTGEGQGAISAPKRV